MFKEGYISAHRKPNGTATATAKKFNTHTIKHNAQPNEAFDQIERWYKQQQSAQNKATKIAEKEY